MTGALAGPVLLLAAAPEAFALAAAAAAAAATTADAAPLLALLVCLERLVCHQGWRIAALRCAIGEAL